MQFCNDFRSVSHIFEHFGHLGGTPWHPWASQGAPDWISDRFLSILGSPLGGLGRPLALTFGPSVHQVRQRKVRNGINWAALQEISPKLAFRTASCGPRTGSYAKCAANMHVLVRCQYCNFTIKSDPRDTPKCPFGALFLLLGSSMWSF